MKSKILHSGLQEMKRLIFKNKKSFSINGYYDFLHIFTCVFNLLKLTPLEEKKEELDLLGRNSIMGRVVENYWMYYDFVEEE